jgi:hypothetical protein
VSSDPVLEHLLLAKPVDFSRDSGE